MVSRPGHLAESGHRLRELAYNAAVEVGKGGDKDAEELSGVLTIELQGLAGLLLRLPMVRPVCAELQEYALTRVNHLISTVHDRGV